MNELHKEIAIQRFMECNLGIHPEELGFKFVEKYKDLYVFGTSQKCIDYFLKFEKIHKCFCIISPIFILVLLSIVTWIAITQSIASIICLWISGCLGFAGIAYIFNYSGKYMKYILNNNVITITIFAYGTRE